MAWTILPLWLVAMLTMWQGTLVVSWTRQLEADKAALTTMQWVGRVWQWAQPGLGWGPVAPDESLVRTAPGGSWMETWASMIPNAKAPSSTPGEAWLRDGVARLSANVLGTIVFR